ncbi:DUF3822 family protein [Olivibacter domesticus]|uniref:DUF3822 family protein n=1 Tax=Olivibacter domesticus TaxID=407022 RepID=A0A1H7PFB9_OLID1|nr:DUF3822 family protein [Olivibacter domesticus]SEL34462.1 Protein of unknown function [Olivibacter domesticus]
MSELLRIEFIDDNFTIEKSEAYQLLIHWGKAWNQLSVLDEDNCLLLLLSWQKNQEEDRVTQLLSLNYKTVKIVYDNHNILLVPNNLYSPSQDIHYLNMLCLDREHHKLYSHSLNYWSIQCLFTIPDEEINSLKRYFQIDNIRSKSAILIDTFSKLLDDKDSFLSINFNDGSAEYTYFKDKKLVYHNLQPTTNADEFNYFLLAISQQLEIDLFHTIIYISGKIGKTHEYYQRMAKYSTNIIFFDASQLLDQSLYTNAEVLVNNPILMGLLCE